MQFQFRRFLESFSIDMTDCTHFKDLPQNDQKLQNSCSMDPLVRFKRSTTLQELILHLRIFKICIFFKYFTVTWLIYICAEFKSDPFCFSCVTFGSVTTVSVKFRRFWMKRVKVSPYVRWHVSRIDLIIIQRTLCYSQFFIFLSYINLFYASEIFIRLFCPWSRAASSLQTK